jgi:hypothetical protein
MIERFLEWLGNLIPSRDRTEEVDLQRKVKEEHQRLLTHRRRANKVLNDFHRADAVVLGNRRGESK